MDLIGNVGLEGLLRNDEILDGISEVFDGWWRVHEQTMKAPVVMNEIVRAE
jgi:hypothetical protein